MDMYGRRPTELLPNERRAAQFCAGYRRWKSFTEDKWYAFTRTLPGHDNPIVNPYRGPRKIPRPQQKIEEELDAAAAPAKE
jgi:hypothetical protein